MRLAEILQALQAAGTEQNRKVYRRHGVLGEQYGVSFATLKALRKQIKLDHALALGLWRSCVHDARVLATMVADPHAADDELIEAWAGEVDNYVLSDYFAEYVERTAQATRRMQEWVNAQDEWHARAGWRLLNLMALHQPELPDEFFLPYLTRIEAEIHTSLNRVREAMNTTLIAIGMRNPRLESLALAAATRIGKVVVDHGETNCKTPDAAAYIQKAVARQQARKVKA